MDYRDLLKRYVWAVSESEGDAFAVQVGVFGDDERAVLSALLTEADADRGTTAPDRL
jgi:hypothetical protein